MGKRKVAILIDEFVWRDLKILARKGGGHPGEMVEAIARDIIAHAGMPKPVGVKKVEWVKVTEKCGVCGEIHDPGFICSVDLKPAKPKAIKKPKAKPKPKSARFSAKKKKAEKRVWDK